MIRIVYASFATVPFTDADLDALLEKSRRYNKVSGVTGMLLYRDGDYLQVLEGEEAAVRETYDRIAADPRHAGIVMLDESTITEREFGEWSMGFQRLTRAEAPEGFVDYFRSMTPASGGHAGRILAFFREIGQ